jgi:hypothetical protein
MLICNNDKSNELLLWDAAYEKVPLGYDHDDHINEVYKGKGLEWRKMK